MTVDSYASAETASICASKSDSDHLYTLLEKERIGTAVTNATMSSDDCFHMLVNGDVDAAFVPQHKATIQQNLNCNLASLNLGTAPSSAEAVVYYLPVDYVVQLNASHPNSDQLSYALKIALSYMMETGYAALPVTTAFMIGDGAVGLTMLGTRFTNLPVRNWASQLFRSCWRTCMVCSYYTLRSVDLCWYSGFQSWVLFIWAVGQS